ncbi:MAG: hypothetical protein J7L17_02910 [Thaumarchaeota archaeon]|nr:hypothetical protein [Nitrososphaerota archaeon]
MPWKFTYIFNGGRRFISRRKAREVLDWILQKRRRRLEEEDRKLLTRLDLLLRSDTALSPVTEVVEEDYDGYVYDLSVPKTEAFYGGLTPVLLHNTGHGGLSTIHAESIESVMKRLVSPPMNIPASHIPLLDAVTLVERVRLPRSAEGRTYGRRIRYIWEVVDYNRYVTVAEWDPATDTFREDFMNSIVLEKIAARSARSKEEMIMEIERRAELLKRMVERNLLEIRDIAREVYAYYSDPEQVLRKYGVTPMLVPAAAPVERPEVKPVAEATKAIKQDTEGGEDAIAESILRILEANNGEYPLWKIFIELETSKIAVFKALKKLRESGVIEMSQSMVRLTGS